MKTNNNCTVIAGETTSCHSRTFLAPVGQAAVGRFVIWHRSVGSAGIYEFMDPRHFRRGTSSFSRKVLRASARALKHSGMTQSVGLRRAFLERCLTMTMVVSLIFFSIQPPPASALVEPNLTNVLGNASFEDALGESNLINTANTGVFRGNWDNTPNRGISTPTTAGAPDGSRVLQLSEAQLTAGTAGAFTFQTVRSGEITGGIGEGTFATFSVFYRYPGGDQDGATFAQIQIEFRDANGTQIGDAVNSLDLALTANFTQATVNGTAPAGTERIVFTIRLQGDVVAGETTDAQFDQAVGTISKFPIVMDASASKPNVTKGGATYISARIKNISAINLNTLELVAEVPEGFTFIDSASRLDGVPINSRQGSRIFTLGSIGSGENKKLGFLLVASQMVQIGKKYEVSFFVRQTNGVIRSATRSLILTIVADPLFDEGTIVGKVFDDQNENAVQDEGEHGVPGVKLATEEGIVVVTDPHGRYHIPAVKPGRHLVKIDGHTLPQQTKFVTEESVLVKTTEGMLNVVNFAAKLPEPQIPKQYRDQLNVLITQGTDVSVPELSIAMEPDVLRMGLGYFEKDPIFMVKTNYAELINGWRIEVRDEFGDEVWTGYGLGSPPKEAPWTGKTKSREPIQSGVYSYRLIVRDREGREDWTSLRYFRVVSKLDKGIPDEPKIDVPAVGNMTIERDGKRSIPIAGKPTLEVRGTTVPWNTITVNGEPVTVNLDGTFQKELYTQPGRQAVQITTTDPEGNSVSHQEEVVVKDSYFFMVALGEQEFGANVITDGNQEVVGRDKKFHHGFYEEGRLAYYLKGRIKGKFLVTSRYDTDDPRGELFRNLDPDHYYPVYGDGSEINYDAFNTKQRFYILVEADKGSLKWGSFHTNFTDTELATHNRTFSGLKIKYETLSATRYGDAKRGFVVYTADSDQLADHNEFQGTGGSLFYLRNKNVIQGSEKARIEVRDKIQGVTVYSRDLVFGTDYEIDYSGGRIILRKPLSAVSFSDTIISNDILNGSETYLIVDYEFDPQGFVSDRNNGVRGFMHMGDHFRVGGTALEERRDGRDYDLRGIDLTSKFGRNTKVVAEYARTQERTQRNAVSYNGGITFTDIPTGNTVIKKATQLFDDAYLIKAETKAKTGTEISGYAQQINAGFANADLIRQAGTRKAGIELRQKVGEPVQLSYRFDRQKATDPENKADVFVTSPKESKVHTAQLKMDYDRYLAVTEYRNQDVALYDDRERSLTTALDDVQFKNAAAVKAGYRVYPDLMPYGKVQSTWGGTNEPNHQFGGGVEAKVLKGKGTVRVEQMAGTIGDSTQLGFDVQTSETAHVYTNLRTGPALDGSRTMSTTIGSSSQVNAKSRFYSERELSSYRTGERMANIMGYDTKLTDKWGTAVSFERSHVYDINEVNAHRNAGALEISYLDREFLKVISRYELRFDGPSDDRVHWLFRDTVDWKINPDYSFSARFDRGDTNRVSARALHSEASFTELNMGVAYRPVHHNRLNVLTRYTWLDEVGAEAQFDTPDIFGIEVGQSSHIFGLEFGYEVLPPLLGWVEKVAYRRTSIEAEGDAFYIGNFLWVNRFNFHIVRKWDLAIEYRMLWDLELLDALKHGVLVEIDREIADYIRFGIGYNFTDFDDDLRSPNDFSAHGFFTRLSGKF
ncbi:MAG: hypothetical protein HY584_00050 [Candidatus Omnitrophica bacterium]|nr:hypothetical protein [Candidatus Omnitrophota bacterium]